MKTEDLLLAIGQAEPEYLEQSEPKPDKRKKLHILAYVAAAVIVLCSTVAAYNLSQSNIRDVSVRQVMKGVIVDRGDYAVSIGGHADVTLKMELPADAPSTVETYYVPKLMDHWKAREIITTQEDVPSEETSETYLTWEDSDGNTVIFRQIAAPGYVGQYAIDTVRLGYQSSYQTGVKTIGEYELHTVTVEPSKMEKDGIVAEDDGTIKLYWSDGAYLFIMEVNYDMSETLLEEIFNSIEQVESITPYQNFVYVEAPEIRQLPSISILMLPTRIPDGWKQTHRTENPTSEVRCYWRLESEEEQMSVIEFTQTTDEGYHADVLFLREASIKEYTVESQTLSGIAYKIFVSENQTQIIWQAGGYYFSLDNTGENIADTDALLAMAQSVQPTP